MDTSSRKTKHSYQGRLFRTLFIVFTLFTFAVISFQYIREKRFRTVQLETRLDNIAGFTRQYILRENIQDTDQWEGLDSLAALIPGIRTRITVIRSSGAVLYDSFVEDYKQMENHRDRPEVIAAIEKAQGTNIRRSATTGQEFFYYAHARDDLIIRCAMVYGLELRSFLRADRIFLLFVVLMFVLSIALLILVTRRNSQFINQLLDFAQRAGRNETIASSPSLSDAELDEIQKQIIRIYNDLNDARKALMMEKERLYNHLMALDEGIAFFTPGKEVILRNKHFIQYINLIARHKEMSAAQFFVLEDTAELNAKIEIALDPAYVIDPQDLPRFESTLKKSGKYFKIKAQVFADKNIEVVIRDVTRPEKRRLMKQELTSNIAHELKTPLASIRGYLETVVSNIDMEREQIGYFSDRALLQCDRLEHLLNDVSLLNHIEDAGSSYARSVIRVGTLIQEVLENFGSRLRQQEIELEIDVAEDVLVSGNENLLYSVFQNLIENTVTHAGEKVKIRIKRYLEDEQYHYFSYADNGKGVDDEHLRRIFERFYRVDRGRTRSAGGTGLGLAIVKNAIQLHQGSISVRPGKEGGLEFLFSLEKPANGQNDNGPAPPA